MCWWEEQIIWASVCGVLMEATLRMGLGSDMLRQGRRTSGGIL